MPLRHHSASDVNYAWVPPTQSRESIHEWCLTMCSHRGAERTRLQQEEEKIWDCVSCCLCSPLRQPLACALCNAAEIHHHTALLRRIFSPPKALVLKCIKYNQFSFVWLGLKTYSIDVFFFKTMLPKPWQTWPIESLELTLGQCLCWTGLGGGGKIMLSAAKNLLIKGRIHPKIIILSLFTHHYVVPNLYDL